MKIKKKLKKYGKGGEIPEKKKIEDSFVDANNFLKSWQQSPMYNEMLNNSSSGNEYSKISNYRNKSLNLNPTNNLNVEKTLLNDPNTTGFVRKGTPIVNISSDWHNNNEMLSRLKTESDTLKARLGETPDYKIPTNFVTPSTIVHEMSHITDWKGLPKTDLQKIKSFSSDRDKNKFSNYVANPSETRSRLNEIRYENSLLKYYNPLTEKINKDQYNNYLKDKSKGNALKDLKNVYSDDEIIDMLNSISENKSSQEQIPMAKNGGKNKDTEYLKWKSKLPKNLQYEGDYDLRGFYNENPNFNVNDPNQHLTDKFKLPNHPTFSNESKYFNMIQPQILNQAGHWQETDSSFNYIPYNTMYKDTIIEKFKNGGSIKKYPNGGDLKNAYSITADALSLFPPTSGLGYVMGLPTTAYDMYEDYQKGDIKQMGLDAMGLIPAFKLMKYSKFAKSATQGINMASKFNKAVDVANMANDVNQTIEKKEFGGNITTESEWELVNEDLPKAGNGLSLVKTLTPIGNKVIPRNPSLYKDAINNVDKIEHNINDRYRVQADDFTDKNYPTDYDEDSGHNDYVDALRHSATAMYTTSGQGNFLAPLKVPYTNVMGLAHELKGLGSYVSNPDKLTWQGAKQQLRETGSDLYNNFVGSMIGGLPINIENKEKILKFAKDKNILSDLSKKQNGGKLPKRRLNLNKSSDWEIVD